MKLFVIYKINTMLSKLSQCLCWLQYCTVDICILNNFNSNIAKYFFETSEKTFYFMIYDSFSINFTHIKYVLVYYSLTIYFVNAIVCHFSTNFTNCCTNIGRIYALTNKFIKWVLYKQLNDIIYLIISFIWMLKIPCIS